MIYLPEESSVCEEAQFLPADHHCTCSPAAEAGDAPHGASNRDPKRDHHGAKGYPRADRRTPLRSCSRSQSLLFHTLGILRQVAADLSCHTRGIISNRFDA